MELCGLADVGIIHHHLVYRAFWKAYRAFKIGDSDNWDSGNLPSQHVTVGAGGGDLLLGRAAIEKALKV